MSISYKLDAERGREFENYQLRLAPPWLRTAEGEQFLRAFGKLKDRLIARAKEAVKAGFPASAPSDALPSLGADVGLERGLTESDDSYRARIAAAHDAWRWAGTEKGLLQFALAPTGLSNCGIITNRDWQEYFPDVPGGGTLYIATPPDGENDRWSRFWLVIGEPHPWSNDGTWDTGSTWGEGGDPGVWGTDASAEQIEEIRRLVAAWSPAHATCEGVFIVLNNGTGTSPSVVPHVAPWSFLDLRVGADEKPVTFWTFGS